MHVHILKIGVNMITIPERKYMRNVSLIDITYCSSTQVTIEIKNFQNNVNSRLYAYTTSKGVSEGLHLPFSVQGSTEFVYLITRKVRWGLISRETCNRTNFFVYKYRGR